jgi:hypothetical protein
MPCRVLTFPALRVISILTLAVFVLNAFYLHRRRKAARP